MKKLIKCGNIEIGGTSPISIQSMTNTKTEDIASTLEQIRQLESAGCQIIRMAVPSMDAAEAFKKIKEKAHVPLVADIHFDYRLAIAAIEAGADKVRINPGNIGDEEGVRKVVEHAKARRIPIRVGVNSGSLEKSLLSKYGGVTAEALAESAINNVALLEKLDFDDIVISLKSSDVIMNHKAYKIVNEATDYPLHIGVTEAGTPSRGKIKSAAGIGALLLEGIGNTMRVSLTANPVEEVKFAHQLLAALGMKNEDIEIVSCPTCGRTEVDLEALANEMEARSVQLVEKGIKNLKIAVMGCAVNGPGEARGADIGVACGKGKGVLFAKGEIIKQVKEEDIVDELMKMAEQYAKNTGKLD